MELAQYKACICEGAAEAAVYGYDKKSLNINEVDTERKLIG